MLAETAPINRKFNEDPGLFLAAIFETGGEMNIKTQVQLKPRVDGTMRSTCTSSPQMILVGDTSYTWDLPFCFGGVSTPTKEHNSYRWSASGPLCIALSDLIKPYVRSRKLHVKAFAAWAETSCFETRVQISRVLREQHEQRFEGIAKEDYFDLVVEPLFLRGITAARRVGPYPTEDSTKEEKVIHSVNRPMLEALRQIYGGNLYPQEPSGVISNSLHLRQRPLNRFNQTIESF